MPRDKSSTILGPKPSPHGPLLTFSAVAKGQGQRSPKLTILPVLSLPKSSGQSRGLGSQPVAQERQPEPAALEGDIFTGLDNSREEQEVEELALPEKPGVDYDSSENELSNTSFLGQAGLRCPEQARDN
jgi:hypothetical protein